uniref:Guanine nucleotide-binding protein G(O) subunit alpha n=1 Tax=Romanomermis culicivorax TaxID=13658 RepID=A0A915JM74_ROMCU
SNYSLSLIRFTVSGPNTYESTTAFIEEQFQSRKENPNKLVYVHKTCATDPQNVQFVFDACMHIIIGGNLKSTGLT